MPGSSLVALLGSSLMACTGGGAAGSAVAAAPAPAPLTPSRVDSFRVVMPELGNRQRTVRVYLPKGYAGSTVSFPVLYLQDAQQLYSPGPYGDWLVDETLDRLVDGGRTRGLIVVGIDNGERRWDEYGPWVNARMHDWVDAAWARPAEGGEGAAYLAWMANTLKPEIDRRYRTLRDPEHTGIGGSSMGGLIALYAGLTRPDVFSRVLAMSPAVWFAEGGAAAGDGGGRGSGRAWLAANQLLADLRARAPLPRNVRFYVDVGTNERSRDTDPGVVHADGRPVTYPQAYVEGAQAAVEALRAGGVPEANVKYVVDQGAVHHESAWSRRLADAVLWLYH